MANSPGVRKMQGPPSCRAAGHSRGTVSVAAGGAGETGPAAFLTLWRITSHKMVAKTSEPSLAFQLWRREGREDMRSLGSAAGYAASRSFVRAGE